MEDQRKSWKGEKLEKLPIRSLHSLKDDHVAYGSMKEAFSASQPHSNGWGWTHCRKVCRNFSWTWVPWRWESLREKESCGWEIVRGKDQSAEMRERQMVFVGRKCGSWRYRERWKGEEDEEEWKEKEIVGNRWKILKRRECIWWLNYM